MAEWKWKCESVSLRGLKCEPCLFDSSDQDVSSFCTVCTEFLCKACTRDHKKNKVTRTHCVLEGNVVPKDSKAFKMMKKMTSCSKHPDIVVSYKCDDHGDFICITCLALDHRKCENVSEICKIENQEVSSDMVSEIKQKLKGLRHYTKSVKSLQEETIRGLISEQNRVKNEVKTYIDSNIKKLRRMGELFKAKTEQVVAKEIVALQQSVVELNEVEETHDIENDLLDTTHLYGNEKEKSVICCLLLNKTKELETAYKARDNVKHIRLQFEQNETLNKIDNLGEIKVVTDGAQKHMLTKNETHLEKASDEVQESSSINRRFAQDAILTSMAENNHRKASVERVTFMQRTVSSADFYRVRNETDSQTCSVRGSVILPNDQIVIIDSSNRKIKVFNPDFTFACELELNDTPRDICYLVDKCIALLFDDKKYILIYAIHIEAVLYERSQMMNRFGIAISGNKGWEAAVLCSEKRRRYFSSNTLLEIQIRNLWDGRGKKIIPVDHLVANGYFDSCSMHCTNEHKLYILCNQKLHCFDVISKPSGLDLEEKWFYKSHRILLSDPADVTTDSEGNVYICGKTSGNVHQICGKNRWKNRLVVSGVISPATVAVNSRKGEIIVGCENDDYIHVYTFIG